MATFTQEEYDDQARIERGYDQLLTTLVPFSMDPAYSSISHMVCFRDRVVGATPRDGGYRIIDGRIFWKKFLEENLKGLNFKMRPSF